MRPGPERDETAVMRAALALVVWALAGLAAWQDAMPRSFESPWGLNPLGIEIFRGGLGLPRFAVSEGAYRIVFRALLSLAWGGYFSLVFAGFLGGRLGRRPVLAATAALVLL